MKIPDSGRLCDDRQGAGRQALLLYACMQTSLVPVPAPAPVSVPMPLAQQDQPPPKAEQGVRPGTPASQS